MKPPGTRPRNTSPMQRLLRHPWRVVACLAGLLAVAALAGPHLYAWHHLRAGRAADAAYHPEEARDALARCLAVWPDCAEARLLACRAARRLEDFPAADAHLRALQATRPEPTDESSLEWALMRAAAGQLDEVEVALYRRAESDPDRAPLVWEALAEGYVRLYRFTDALACADKWLRSAPDNVRALELRGDAWWRGRAADRASAEYDKAVRLDPALRRARWRLALCLLDRGRYDEALAHLEEVRKTRPDDPDVLARLARCQQVLGRNKQARELLDAALAKAPDSPLLLATRGQFELMAGRDAEAEPWLRRAVAAAPGDYAAAFALAGVLQRQGKEAEASSASANAERLKERRERLHELTTRTMAERPNDPSVHAELGSLLAELGYPDVGRQWLRSALAKDPGHAAARAALTALGDPGSARP